MVNILFIISTLTGNIIGKVHSITETPLVGANVTIIGTKLGASTDTNGEFRITHVPVGIYTIQVSMIGYEPVNLSYVIVSATRTTDLEIKLKPMPIKLKEVVVRPSYFTPKKEAQISVSDLSQKEIKRTTGAYDVSRMVQTLPGINVSSDDRNDLVIRGGSPIENLYFLDGIPIPNPHHFASLGSGGGVIGIINTQFIRSVKFFSGGFPPKYGDVLSGVIDIKYKEGEKTNNVYMFDMSMAGAGLVFDGSVGNISYLLSARRSYLDIFAKTGAISVPGIPNNYDVQGKLRYKINQNNYNSIIWFLGDSWIDIAEREHIQIWHHSYQYAIGNRYDHLVKNGMITFIISQIQNNYDVIVKDSVGEFYKNESFERNTQAKLIYEFMHKIHGIECGCELTHSDFSHNIWVRDIFDMSRPDETWSSAAFFQIKNNFGKLLTTYGLRWTYFDYTNVSSLSPRVSTSIELSHNLHLNFGLGKYYQHPLFIWLTSNDTTGKLKDMSSIHYILGIDYFLRPDMKLSTEIYYKYYDDYPVDIRDSSRILLNEGASYEGYINFNPLGSVGEGKVLGTDLALQKKFTHGVYGTMVYSYTKTEFLPLDRKPKPSVLTPKHNFKFVTGIKLKYGYELGVRFVLSDGKYYYPIDSLKSANENHLVRDYSRMEKYPIYHKLDLRIERLLFHKKFTIRWYTEINNVYNQKNIKEYYWDDNKKRIEPSYQWGFMPVGGFELEF